MYSHVDTCSVLHTVKDTSVKARLVNCLLLHLIFTKTRRVSTSRSRLTRVNSNIKVDVQRRLHTVLNSNLIHVVKASRHRFSALYQETISRVASTNTRRVMTSKANAVHTCYRRAPHLVLHGVIKDGGQRAKVANQGHIVISNSVVGANAHRGQHHGRRSRRSSYHAPNGGTDEDTVPLGFSVTNKPLPRRSRALRHATYSRTRTERRSRRHR